jgi:hypothetical protein
MISFQLPSRAQETTFSRQGEDSPLQCDKFGKFASTLNKKKNIPIGHLKVQKSDIENGGRGLYAAQDIPKGSVLDMKIRVQDFHIFPSTWSIIQSLYGWADDNDIFPSIEDELAGVVAFTEGALV